MPAITKFSNFNEVIMQDLEHTLISHGNISKVGFELWLLNVNKTLCFQPHLK